MRSVRARIASNKMSVIDQYLHIYYQRIKKKGDCITMKSKKKMLLCGVNIIAIVALTVVACVLPSKIAEKHLNDVFN